MAFIKKICLVLTAIYLSLALSDGLLQFLPKYKQWFQNDGAKIHKEITWFREYSYHPYLGYYNKTEFEKPKELQKFKIAILGGSYADQLYYRLRKKHKTALASVFGKKEEDIQIFNFAAGGYAQPIQLIVASLYTDNIDVVISIEGFNELFTGHYSCLPEEWTAFGLRYWPQMQSSVYLSLAHLLHGAADSLHTASIQPNILSRPLRPLYYILGPYILPWSFGLTNAHLMSAAKDICGSAESNKETHYAHRLENWMTYLRKMKSLSAEKKMYVFFQPNLHLKSSKQLSHEEELLRSQEDRSQDIHKWYTNAREQFSKLPADIFIDITDVYKSSASTLYKDSCCHVNAEGNDIAIERLLKELQLRQR